MKPIIKILPFSLLVILILSGCYSNSEKEDIFQYKDSFVGDNSAVGSIAKQLRSAEHLKGFELETKEKPYGITLNYDLLKSEHNYKKTVIYNATYLFTLIQNADWITFNFNNREYKITKENLQNWYGKDLIELKNEDERRKLTQKYLGDEDKVNQLFK